MRFYRIYFLLSFVLISVQPIYLLAGERDDVFNKENAGIAVGSGLLGTIIGGVVKVASSVAGGAAGVTVFCGCCLANYYSNGTCGKLASKCRGEQKKLASKCSKGWKKKGEKTPLITQQPTTEKLADCERDK